VQIGLVIALLPLTGFAAFSAEVAPAPRRADAKELEEFRGDWALVKQTLPDGTVRRYRAVRPIFSDENLAFDGRKLVTELTYCDPTDTMVEGVELDPKQAPKWIDLTLLDASFPLVKRKGQTRRGIYEFDGDRLRLCVGDYGAKRPTGFQPGKGHDIYEYKRIKP
jgi:uncharacterized protein (TIGR03067 family)